MANQEHLTILNQGVEAWNQWRVENRRVRPNLMGADLFKADLRDAKLNGANLLRANLRETALNGADLRDANLGGVDLNGTDLRGATLSAGNLSRATLIGADLSGATLINAKLNSADLSGATLNSADLFKADLTGTNFSSTALINTTLIRATLIDALFINTLFFDTDFTDTRIGGTVFANVDLSTLQGIETIEHKDPSTIGLDTIYKSKSKIPQWFLHRAGVPDEFIIYLHGPSGGFEQNCSVVNGMLTQEQKLLWLSLNEDD